MQSKIMPHNRFAVQYKPPFSRMKLPKDLRRHVLDAKIDKLRREMGVQLRWIIGIVIGAMLTMTGVFAWIVDRMLTP